MHGQRYLIVTADDYGIGRATSQAILDLAAGGPLTSSVLLVTSPGAEEAVQSWRRAGEPLELGWHPCLTLDRPVTPARLVSSLLGPDGCFWPLGKFVQRLGLGLIRAVEIETELWAQYERFRQLVGRPPSLINSHHHVQVFPPVGAILRAILAKQKPLPYFRRIQESWHTLVRVPGARGKRSFLTFLGRREAGQQKRLGFPGNDWLVGVTNPPCVADPRFLVRWLKSVPGQIVELTCHPGYFDASLVGRDCTATDGQLERRVHEFSLLRHPSFLEACQQAGFTLAAPSALPALTERPFGQAA